MTQLTFVTSKATSEAGSECTIQGRSGRFCNLAAWPDMPFPICKQHAIDLYMEMRGIHGQAIVDLITGLPTLDPQFIEERESRSLAKLEKRKADNSVVYYARTGDRIKIGFTSDLTVRMRSIRVQPHDVLATEPGDRGLESLRHAEFADIRIGRREDFKPTQKLLDHIETVRKFHGAPIFRKENGDAIAS